MCWRKLERGKQQQMGLILTVSTLMYVIRLQNVLVGVSMTCLPGAGEKHVDLSTKKINNNKTATRLTAETSTMTAFSNMLTCLTNHFLEGERPRGFDGQIDFSTLSPEVTETFEMMNE
jgi:hypothetical protein